VILSHEQISSIILDNPGADRVKRGLEYSKKLRRHIYGEGLSKHLSCIHGFENENLQTLRAKYTKSNKDLFSRLGRPIDKIFSARGGSIYYNLGEAQEKRARILSQNVRDGYSIRKWVESFWKPHLLDDPFGVIFMEILPSTGVALAKQQGRSYVYPTYKSITTIFDYLPKGNRLEYIVFEVTATEKAAAGIDEKLTVYRVVDDAFDYYVAKEEVNKQHTVRVLDKQTLPNYFGEVPGMINSDIIDPENENCVLSFFDEIIELADQFLLKGSIKVTHDFLHGFPKYSEFADDCPVCNGHKFVGAEKCGTCYGTGKSVMTKVSDVKLLQWPTKEETAIMPNQVGGYISPDKTFHEIATSDIQALEDAMSVTLWGSQSRLQAQPMTMDKTGESKTATQVMDEIKPQSDRLVPVSEMAEARDKFIRDFVIKLQVQQSYPGSSVNYGRRYMLEGPDAIWLKYSDARTKGAPQSVLDALLNEYYEANYQSDPVGLAMAKKLMYVEPFVHLTPAVLKSLSPDPLDYKAKLYFSEWLSLQNEAIILSQDVETLKGQLNDYAATKNIPEEKPPVAA
jgi:hypothetical protein